MEITFPISGVHTYIWLPPLVAFCVSFFTSMVGISGAFLLLPFQMSVLGFVSPAVSGTNLIFNIVAAPGGIFGFLREKRMLWPLAWIIVAGSVPGIFIGGLIRLHWLPDPKHFKVFVGLMLLYVGTRLALDFRRDLIKANAPRNLQAFAVEEVNVSWRRLAYRFQNEHFRCSLPSILGLSLLVGVLGGMYGIGGGAIIAPFLVAIYGLPVYTIAGATLIGTFATSVAGAGFYQVVAPLFSGIQVRPDWMLGILFGLGGCCGTYLGSRSQRYVSSRWLKLLLAILILFISVDYLVFR
jgi:uncharacterized protein